MKLKKYGVEYLISLKRGKDVQTVELTNAESSLQVKNLINNVFKGKFSFGLSNEPLVKILVRKLDISINKSQVIMDCRIKNQSARQARLALEAAIRH